MMLAPIIILIAGLVCISVSLTFLGLHWDRQLSNWMWLLLAIGILLILIAIIWIFLYEYNEKNDLNIIS